MANWRVGYIVADPSVIDACLVVFEWESLHCGYVAQRVAAAAIQGPQEWLDEAFLSYQPKRDLVFEAVADNPWLACLRPPSTPFLFVDVSRLPAAGGSPVELMLAAGVPTVPGWYFGAGGDHVRIPFGAGPETVTRSPARCARSGRARCSGSQLTATNGDRKPVSRIAVDIGETFTDIVVTAGDRVYLAKILSTPPDFGTAVIDGLVGLELDHGLRLAEASRLSGTTVATNAILERRGGRTGLVTTKGFRDVLELGRMRRPTLYDPMWEKPAPLVPRHLRLELDHRITARGDVECAASPADIATIAADLRRQGVESVAVCLLNSYGNPVEEQRIADQLAQLLDGIYVSFSADVLPEIRSTSG